MFVCFCHYSVHTLFVGLTDCTLRSSIERKKKKKKKNRKTGSAWPLYVIGTDSVRIVYRLVTAFIFSLIFRCYWFVFFFSFALWFGVRNPQSHFTFPSMFRPLLPRVPQFQCGSWKTIRPSEHYIQSHIRHQTKMNK